MITLLLSLAVLAQPTSDSPLSPPPNHPRSAESSFHAFTNATIHTSPGETLENATLVIRDGLVLAVGDGPAPAGARVWDCAGLHIFPGFIDPFVEVDAPAPDPNAPGLHWNTRVTPQRSALAGPGLPENIAKELRDLGFTAAGISPRLGHFRGIGAAVSLAPVPADPSAARPPAYAESTYAAVSFDAGGGRGGREAAELGRWASYPNSQMGAIALIRQTLSDAQWLGRARAAGEPLPENALDSLAPWRAEDGRPSWTAHAASGAAAPPVFPLLFDVRDELEALRALKIAAEFERVPILLGSGTEFRRLAALEAAGKPQVILPLSFPRPPDVSTVARADAVELRELMTWEQSPTNPRRMDAAGYHISLTTAKLRSRAEFRDNLLKAMKHGLPRDRALAALTTRPAALLGLGDRLGTIRPGAIASFTIADGDLLALPDEEADPRPPAPKIRDVWIDGLRNEVTPAPALELDGRWAVELPGGAPVDRALVIEDGPAITVERDGKTVKATRVRLVGQTLTFLFDHEPLDGERGIYAATAAIGLDEAGKPAAMNGTLALPNGTIVQWSARPSGDAAADPEKPFLGEWRITEADGQPVAPDDPDIPLLKVEKGGKVSIIPPAGEPIAATEVTFEGGTLRYQYEDGGLWKDSCTIEKGVMVGTSATPQGGEHRFKAKKQPEAPRSAAGRYAMATIDGAPYDGPHTTVTITSTGVVRIAMGEAFTLARDVKVDGVKASYTFDMGAFGGAGDYAVEVERGRAGLSGTFTPPDGSKHTFTATTLKDPKEEDVPETIGYPFGPYALAEPPAQRTIIFHNATVWTSGPEGILEDAAVVISDGKIAFIGAVRELQGFLASARLADEPERIDLAGRHITPGLIDAHSHTGISRGVNESGQACTAEVRIGDVTDPDDISWYRQLAGGITAVNSMHGSANPIGGQTQTNKNRWGAIHPDDMHLEGAKPGIKFALGENVKQSNWGDGNTTRYPQTRMGVESFIRDRFTAAAEYRERMQATKRRSDEATKLARGAAPHEDIPRTHRLATIDGPRPGDVQGHGRDADHGAIRPHVADAQGRDLDPVQHRGGPRAPEPDGLSALPQDGEGIAVRALDSTGTFAVDGAAPTAGEPDGAAPGDGPNPAGAHPIVGGEGRGGLAAGSSPSVAPSLRPSVALPPRRDLELEALAEILAGERLVHCHSYRQDEILMLARMAGDFGFRLGTFQHGLECYKVAEAVRESAIGASLFSDWWAYKVEVQDAIPAAGPILHEQGVLVSFNSDSDELARRMNLEAAKAVKYGGLSPEEALKFVTINPAIQLGVGARIGSIEPGKDADLAIWSGDPLSALSRCESTFVDGRELFSRSADAAHRAAIAAERERLIQKILATDSPRGEGGAPPRARRTLLEQSYLDAIRTHYMGLLERGRHETAHRCGDCGMVLR